MYVSICIYVLHIFKFLYERFWGLVYRDFTSFERALSDRSWIQHASERQQNAPLSHSKSHVRNEEAIGSPRWVARPKPIMRQLQLGISRALSSPSEQALRFDQADGASRRAVKMRSDAAESCGHCLTRDIASVIVRHPTVDGPSPLHSLIPGYSKNPMALKSSGRTVTDKDTHHWQSYDNRITIWIT